MDVCFGLDTGVLFFGGIIGVQFCGRGQPVGPETLLAGRLDLSREGCGASVPQSVQLPCAETAPGRSHAGSEEASQPVVRSAGAQNGDGAGPVGGRPGAVRRQAGQAVHAVLHLPPMPPLQLPPMPPDAHVSIATKQRVVWQQCHGQ